MVIDRRALLAANAAADRPAGGEVDGGDHWQDLLALGPAQDALLMAETRLWRDADEKREREGGGANERDKERLS